MSAVDGERRVLLGALGSAAALSATGCSMTAPTKMPSNEDTLFLERHLPNGRGYRVFVPEPRSAALPVVLFLHGSGERGDDNRAQLQSGLGPRLRARPDVPAMIVFPQAPAERNWSGEVADMAMQALDAAIDEFGGDRQRVGLTGMSRGGYGVWELALWWPGRFAALAPVCGGIEAPPGYPDLVIAALAGAADPYAALAQRLHATPAWLFHVRRDDVVPPDYSRRIVAALRASGGTPRYSEFPDANHNSWDAAYATDALWDWMFEQRTR